MKPRQRGGVADSRLNLYVVRELTVADLSIGPGEVSANTYSTALVIHWGTGLLNWKRNLAYGLRQHTWCDARLCDDRNTPMEFLL